MPGAAAGGGSGAASGRTSGFTVAETCERINEEFHFIQQQYHTLKLEYEKLANEKTEMQRHYVMYYEMSYGLNMEMHKQTEISKRLNVIISQMMMPALPQEDGLQHQQQVLNAVERAKQVTMTELNTIIGQQQQQGLQQLLQQIHAQQQHHLHRLGTEPLLTRRSHSLSPSLVATEDGCENKRRKTEQQQDSVVDIANEGWFYGPPQSYHSSIIRSEKRNLLRSY